ARLGVSWRKMPRSFGNMNFTSPIELFAPGNWRTRAVMSPAATRFQSTVAGSITFASAVQSERTSYPILDRELPASTRGAIKLAERSTGRFQYGLSVAYRIMPAIIGVGV